MALRTQTPTTSPTQTAPTNPAPPAPTAPAAPAAPLTFEVSDFVTEKSRAASKVPDNVATLLEDLREAYGKEAKNAKGETILANAVKYKTVTLPNKDAGETFAKHVRSYSKTVMNPEWSARLSSLSDTVYRVGVGPVKPKPRRKKVVTENAPAPSQAS